MHHARARFVKMLAGKLEADPGTPKPPELNVSLKPQTIAPKFQGTVRMLLIKQIKGAFMHPQFTADVVKPMQLDNIIDQDVQTLSGGELQRVALVMALGKPADIYLIDEPSAYLEWVCAAPSPSCIAADFNLAQLGAAHHCRTRHQALHPAQQKDGHDHRARHHHGHLPRRPRRRLRGPAVRVGNGQAARVAV
jgi:hypothetical protein